MSKYTQPEKLTQQSQPRPKAQAQTRKTPANHTFAGKSTKLLPCNALHTFKFLPPPYRQLLCRTHTHKHTYTDVHTHTYMLTASPPHPPSRSPPKIIPRFPGHLQSRSLLVIAPRAGVCGGVERRWSGWSGRKAFHGSPFCAICSLRHPRPSHFFSSNTRQKTRAKPPP